MLLLPEPVGKEEEVQQKDIRASRTRISVAFSAELVRRLTLVMQLERACSIIWMMNNSDKITKERRKDTDMRKQYTYA